MYYQDCNKYRVSQKIWSVFLTTEQKASVQLSNLFLFQERRLWLRFWVNVHSNPTRTDWDIYIDFKTVKLISSVRILLILRALIFTVRVHLIICYCKEIFAEDKLNDHIQSLVFDVFFSLKINHVGSFKLVFCTYSFTVTYYSVYTKINTLKIGKIVKFEINLLFLKLMYLSQFVSNLSKLRLKI